MRVSVPRYEQSDLNQAWLDSYELEVYLLINLIKLGYKTTEVPATKIYPPKSVGNTKKRPIIDWWHILQPILLFDLGLRR